MNIPMCFDITPIGYVHSTLEVRSNAPRQGWEGAPAAGLEILPAFVQGVDGIKAGEEIWIFTWLHEARRSVLKVHPRDDVRKPMKGVFATRSPDRPNPIGLHRAKVLSVAGVAGCRCRIWRQSMVLQSWTSSRLSNGTAIFEGRT